MQKKNNQSNSRFPDFLFVGTGRSGTTSIDNYLRKHPDVVLPRGIKETLFWHIISNDNKAQQKYLPPVMSLDNYLNLFKHAKEHQVIGEITPSYLYFHKHVINNIKKLHPNWQKLKIIIILREPVSKVNSQFNFVTNRLGFKDLSLSSALKKENKRKQSNALPDLFYFDSALYYEAVKGYLDNFEQVKVFLYDDFLLDSNKFMDELHDFIGVSPYEYNVDVLDKKINSASSAMVPKNLFYYYLLRLTDPFSEYSKFIQPQALRKCIHRYVTKTKLIKHTLDDTTKRTLKARYEEDIKKLNSIIKPDITHWLK